MRRFSGTFLILCFHAAFCLPSLLGVAQAQTSSVTEERPAIAEWTASSVEHAYGLPETKAHQKGSLTVNSAGVTFTGKSAPYHIPSSALVAVSAGDERVELWGMKGRLLRMAIPNGGGLAAAGFMHHKVNMLSVEFKDSRDGYHAAVFYVTAADAQHVLASFADLPTTQNRRAMPNEELAIRACHGGSFSPHSVLLTIPAWDKAEVPSAYRALLYEHAIDRLQHVQGIGHVYREGENPGQNGCPEYTIQIALSAFKQGSQVKRAVMGPVGFFVGTTQLTFDVTIADAKKQMNFTQQLKATVRGEGESKTVADSVAKTSPSTTLLKRKRLRRPERPLQERLSSSRQRDLSTEPVRI